MKKLITAATLTVCSALNANAALSAKEWTELTQQLEQIAPTIGGTSVMIMSCSGMQDDGKEVHARFQRLMKAIGAASGNKRLTSAYWIGYNEASRQQWNLPDANCNELRLGAYTMLDTWESNVKGSSLHRKAWLAAGAR